MALHQMISTQTERLWDLIIGREETVALQEFPLAVSLCYYTATLIFGRVLRLVNKNVTPGPLQPYVADMIVTFQVCACSLENVMIRNSYGMLGYAMILFALSLWFSLTVKEGKGNPCKNILDYTQGNQGMKRTLVRCAMQLIGGLISYRWARGFWYLGLTDSHQQRFWRMHCTAGLSVPSPVGLGVEFGGTLVETLLVLTTFTPFQVCESVAKISFSVFMTLMGVHMTGFYLNPVNATNQEFGCRGVSIMEHIIIYWVGPFLACALAVSLHSHLQELSKIILVRENMSGDAKLQKSTKHSMTNGKPADIKSKKND